MITGPQCRAARALVEISRAKLALRAQVAEEVIEKFEQGLDAPAPPAVAAVTAALEDMGAIFIEDEDNGCGAGVRLKFSRSEAKQISRMEGEGGPVADDVVR